MHHPAGCLACGIRAPGAMVPQGTLYFPRGTRPNPYLANGYQWYMEGISSYNALRADLTKRFSSGLLFRANYTFSKNLDDSYGIASSQSQNQNQSVMDPRHPLRDYGRSALDFRHQPSGNFNYELPFGHGKRFVNGLNGMADRLVGGWQLNGILTLLSGFPLTPLVGTNQSGNGNTFNPDRPNVNQTSWTCANRQRGPVVRPDCFQPSHIRHLGKLGSRSAGWAGPGGIRFFGV